MGALELANRLIAQFGDAISAPAEFRGEITVVLKGTVRVEHENGVIDVSAGQAVVTSPGEWVRYSTPEGGAEYIAVCLPAFSMDTVHRDPE